MSSETYDEFITDTDDVDSDSSGNNSVNDELNKLKAMQESIKIEKATVDENKSQSNPIPEVNSDKFVESVPEKPTVLSLLEKGNNQLNMLKNLQDSNDCENKNLAKTGSLEKYLTIDS